MVYWIFNYFNMSKNEKNNQDFDGNIDTTELNKVLMNCERHQAALKIQRWWNDNKWKIYINWSSETSETSETSEHTTNLSYILTINHNNFVYNFFASLYKFITDLF